MSAPVEVRPARPSPEVELTVPGDKSISHRAILLNSLAEGQAEIRNLGPGADVRSSIACMRQLAVEIDESDGLFHVDAQGFGGLIESRPPLDCGNSGTTARLLSGILAGQPFSSVLVGDQSLSRRPMARVAKPLRLMGATIEGETLPLTIRGGHLHGVEYQPDVASAQVKSCVLLAGLFGSSPTTVVEPVPTRDHTERLLRAMGARVEIDSPRITVWPPSQLKAVDIDVPGDFSSAAFWLVAGLILPAARVTVRNVGMNESRTGLLDVLREMGASVEVCDLHEVGGEPVADLVASRSWLRGVSVGGTIIPRLIDEVPILAVAAALAEGTTSIRDAAELRVKESDRIAAVARGLTSLGVRVEELPDGLIIHGGSSFSGAALETLGDHRLAMAWAIAGLASREGVRIDDRECTSVSYPSFWHDLGRFGEG
ncbi:MAG TPA: 3-phosphoshikimate 1-carboxyvinyltransferase [Chloroflexota bacterium]|nr:3-phosphoshikimate 1-carboxyvinyltransferase [Chloroflexota bacterium]